MTINTNPVPLTYSDGQLRLLVEEFITMQKSEFTFKDVCDYILYWAVEEGKTVDAHNTIYESTELQADVQDKIRQVLGKIVLDGRIATTTGCETKYVKQ